MVCLTFHKSGSPMQEATTLRSALACSLAAAGCPWPAFLPVHDPRRDGYMGVRVRNGSCTYYDADSTHGSSIPHSLTEVGPLHCKWSVAFIHVLLVCMRHMHRACSACLVADDKHSLSIKFTGWSQDPKPRFAELLWLLLHVLQPPIRWVSLRLANKMAGFCEPGLSQNPEGSPLPENLAQGSTGCPERI